MNGRRAAAGTPPSSADEGAAPFASGQSRTLRQILRLPRGRRLDLSSSNTPLVMGIVNVTPDSFSDGGVHSDRQTAIDSALRMEEQGAAIIDVGGESTRPGADPVALDEELRRVVPVIEGIRARSGVAISIDTRRAVVAAAAIAAGADIINDVSALRSDPELAGIAAAADVPVILMHMRGEPKTMQSLAVYGDVVADVVRELDSFGRSARATGVRQLLFDPGIGFAKTFDHNLELLARCSELTPLGPVVIGASRKKFIGHLTGKEGSERVFGSLAAVAAAVRGGAGIVRVHDVAETVDFLRVLAGIEAFQRSPLTAASGLDLEGTGR